MSMFACTGQVTAGKLGTSVALSPAAVRTVEAAGFAAAVTCEERPLRQREHPLRVPRVATCEESGASLGSRLAAMAAPRPANRVA